MCEGRHVIPQVTEYLFGTVINPLDLEGLESTAAEKLQNVDSLDLYVTGLTVATVCVINVCANLGIALTLYHYDRDRKLLPTKRKSKDPPPLVSTKDITNVGNPGKFNKGISPDRSHLRQAS